MVKSTRIRKLSVRAVAAAESAPKGKARTKADLKSKRAKRKADEIDRDATEVDQDTVEEQYQPDESDQHGGELLESVLDGCEPSTQGTQCTQGTQGTMNVSFDADALINPDFVFPQQESNVEGSGEFDARFSPGVYTPDSKSNERPLRNAGLMDGGADVYAGSKSPRCKVIGAQAEDQDDEEDPLVGMQSPKRRSPSACAGSPDVISISSDDDVIVLSSDDDDDEC